METPKTTSNNQIKPAAPTATTLDRQNTTHLAQISTSQITRKREHDMIEAHQFAHQLARKFVQETPNLRAAPRVLSNLILQKLEQSPKNEIQNCIIEYKLDLTQLAQKASKLVLSEPR